MVIIGIVSAITISNLISNTQKQEYVTRLKKADSVLRQSLYNIAAKSGYPIGDFSFMQNDDFFKSFKEEVNVIKVCDSEHRGCFSETAKALNSKNWMNYDYGANSQINTLITNDGISYNYVSGTICSGKGLSNDDLKNCIGRFLVDINGQSKPNKFGLDIFFFAVADGKGIVAAGSGNNSADCKRSSYGITCAAKVLKEGKISY